MHQRVPCRFAHEPFPALYDWFAGKKTGADVLAEMEQKGLRENALVMFFAHYCAALNEDLLGHKDAAREHLAKAVAVALKSGARGGPGYMGRRFGGLALAAQSAARSAHLSPASGILRGRRGSRARDTEAAVCAAV